MELFLRIIHISVIYLLLDLKAKIEIFSQEQGGIIRFKTFQVGSGVSIEELSGNLSQYKDMRIAEEPHKLKPLQVATTKKL